MNPILVVNDLHAGVQRAAGTTPASAAALRQYLQDSFRKLIDQHKDKDLCVLGDLFDGFTVDIQDVLECYTTFVAWLATSPSYSNHLYLVAGNHDIGKRNDKLSSFDVLARLLDDRYPSRVHVIRGGLSRIRDSVYAIPHCMNQDLFDIELARVSELKGVTLMLHCNYDNKFAECSDASLNITDAWAAEFTSRGNTLILAHEHQPRVPRKGVHILGNQWASSVSDCLRNEFKSAWVLDGK